MSSVYGMNNQVSVLDARRSAKTSTSRVFASAGYEISDELQWRRVEVLERRYGGRERAHAAATLIQRAYRDYRLNRRWRQMTTPHSAHHRFPPPMLSAHSTSALPVRLIPGVQRIPPPMELDRHRMRSTTTSALLHRNNDRYTPATSLIAQLRADRAAMGGRHPPPTHLDTRGRSPPSPAPQSKLGGARTMIDSLMSPRLVARRFIGSPGNPEREVSPIVWVPRYPMDHSHHTNSLPRLHKKERREPSVEVSVVSSEQQDSDRKRQYRVALNFFNKNPSKGVELLTQMGFIDDRPETLAKLMFCRRGLSKQKIGEYLGEPNSFVRQVRYHFIQQVEVVGLEVDVALRRMLLFFRLPGEAQKIERVIQTFSEHYARSNSAMMHRFPGGEDTVFIIAFAIIILQTDLHSRNIKNTQRMNREQFIKNVQGAIKGKSIDVEALKSIYDRINREEIVPGEDHVTQVEKVEEDIIGKDRPRLSEAHRRLVSYCKMHFILDVAKKQPPTAHERDVFLFNDMIVVTKGKPKKANKSGHQFTLKTYSYLLNAHVDCFSRPPYENGIMIVCPDGPTLNFNAKSYDDRKRFVNDVRESIMECAQMEEVRLEMELGKQLPKNNITHSVSSSGLGKDSQRDSGLPDGMSDDFEGECSTRSRSSQQNGSTRTGLQRRTSYNSLDSGVVEESDPST